MNPAGGARIGIAIVIPIAAGVIAAATAAYGFYLKARGTTGVDKGLEGDWSEYTSGNTPSPSEFGEDFANEFRRYSLATSSILVASSLASESKAAAEALQRGSDPSSPSFLKPIVDAALGDGVPPARIELIQKTTRDQIVRDIDDSFNRIVHEPLLRQAFDPNVIDGLRQQGRSLHEALVELHLTPGELSQRFNVRPDVAALATNAILGTRFHNVSPSSYDPNSGAVIMPLSVDRASGRNSDWALIDLLDAQNAGATPEFAAALEKDYRDALAIDEDPSPRDASGVLIQVLHAEQRGATDPYLRGLKAKYENALRGGGPPVIATTASPPPTGDASLDAITKLTSSSAAPAGAGVPSPSSFLAKGLNLALVTSPLWGSYLWKRARS